MPLKLVRRKGSDNWYIRGTVRGESIYESCGTSAREEAEAVRIKREARALTESIHGRKATIKFSEAADHYVANGGSDRYLFKEHKDGTVSGLALHFRGRLLKDIGQADLDAAAQKLFPTANPETRNRQCYTPFIAVWNHAVRHGWADLKVWQRPRKPKGTNIRRLKPARAGTTPVEYARAARFVSAMTPATAMVMTALFYTGMRPIELFLLEAEDVNVAGRWITLLSSKTSEPRGVPMHDFLVPLFEALCARGGRVFRTHKGEGYPVREEEGGQISTAISGARERLRMQGTPIDEIAPYTGRHTVSTQLVVNGIHPYLKDQILGHAVDSMSRHYTSVPQKPLIEAINTLPVPDLWRSLEWWQDPVYWSRRLLKWKKSPKADARRA